MRGYAVAIVVKEHPRKGVYYYHGLKVIPCPHETKGVQCVDCRLCFDDKRLIEADACIGFAAHGVRKESVKRSLDVLNGNLNNGASS